MTLGRRQDATTVADAGPRYRVVRALGEGAFGVVYRARLTASEQEIALKALTGIKPSSLMRFKREFRALAEVNHPNLVGLRELFEHEGRWFIAMDLVEGSDLLAWVRCREGAPGYDEWRLRRVFAGIAQGLSALHAHGLLHRDLKPSNVRVTLDGKAVVLDFGLVTMADEELQSTQRNGIGTLAYMAPEQVSGDKLGPAADVYALGVSLYQALTGRLALEAETPFGLMLRKASEDPRPPRELFPSIPLDLDWLCTALLARDPRARPSLETVLRTLLGPEAARSLPPARVSLTAQEPGLLFEGRDSELARLRKALARTHEGEQSLVFIEGESGIGKSALVAQLERQQLAEQPNTWVLHGRCYEHERVPYKAFDACMDALARRLARLAPEVCDTVLPRHAALLVELFPVLGSIKALADRHAQAAPAEPTARRLEAFAILGDLLGKLAESRALILVVDDLQWADEESLRLLRHLTEERPPPVLLIATIRPDRELSPTVLAALEPLREGKGAQRLLLRGLGEEAIALLAGKLLGVGFSPRSIDQISYESRGHPMLIAELSYYARTHGSTAQNLTLDAALGARLLQLTAASRKLLELLALSGRPRSESLLRSLGLAAVFDDVLKELLAHRFVRRSTDDGLAIAHDRVRAATLTRLHAETQRALHAELAEALAQSGEGEPSELAEHWDRAGETLRASACYLEAAQLARQTLAFGSAAEHYERAFVLLGDDTSAERGRLLTHYGHALAAAGKSAQAATAFSEAAARHAGAERVRLRILATQHQVQSAQCEAGMQDARALLAELGVPLPRGTARSLTRFLWERCRMALRGYRFSTGASVGLEDKLTLDALSSLTFPIGWVDLLPSHALIMMFLRRALDVGDPEHVARALAQGAFYRVLLGGSNDEALFAESQRIAEQTQLSSVQAFVLFEMGAAAVLKGRPAQAREHCETAERLLASAGSGDSYLLINVRMMLGAALFIGGEHPLLAEASERWLSEARERGDAFALAALLGLGFGFASHLMRDAPDDAIEAIARSVEPWRNQPYGFAHHGEMYARVLILSYAGKADEWGWFTDAPQHHDRAFVHAAGPTRDNLLVCRILADLNRGIFDSAAREPLLRRVVSHVRKLSGGSLTRPQAPLAMAQVQALRGDRERALRTAAEAHAEAKALGNEIVEGTAAYLLGVLEGGEQGRSRCVAALAFFEDRGWRDPWRAATMYAPAARALEGDAPRTRPPPLLLGRYRLSTPGLVGDPERLEEAIDTLTGRRVSLRSLGIVGRSALAEVKQQHRLLESIQHESLARIEALHEYQGGLLAVLEPVPQDDFLAYVRPKGTLDLERLRGALASVLSLLATLHESGAAHGDVRPALLRGSETGRVLVLGRGAPKAVTAETEEPQDLAYLAPEQLERPQPTPAADVYALGTCLYEALTGQRPFERPTASKTREAKRHGRPVPPWAQRVEVPGGSCACRCWSETHSIAPPRRRHTRACSDGTEASPSVTRGASVRWRHCCPSHSRSPTRPPSRDAHTSSRSCTSCSHAPSAASGRSRAWRARVGSARRPSWARRSSSSAHARRTHWCCAAAATPTSSYAFKPSTALWTSWRAC